MNVKASISSLPVTQGLQVLGFCLSLEDQVDDQPWKYRHLGFQGLAPYQKRAAAYSFLASIWVFPGNPTLSYSLRCWAWKG